MIGHPQADDRRTIAADEGLQFAVQGLDPLAVGDALGLGEVADGRWQQRRCRQAIGNLAFAQLCSEPEVAVAGFGR
jgi:hypothetical protein